MAQDIRRYVRGCQECAMSKTPQHLPSGKLLPLPIPWHPWPHLGVDFVTDLPPSDGYTCILVIVDRFSKACRLIPLRGLPTAMETTELLFNHVFRNFGLPEDIVSDRGPQFISQVWRSFFSLLGVTVSLSSGYHSQSNGQTERKIQEIGRYLRTFCHSHQNSWNGYLVWAEYAQNSLRQPSTDLTPFQRARGSGTQHINTFSGQCGDRNITWMSGEPPLQPFRPEPGPIDEPSLPMVLEDGTVCSVKEILNSRRRGGFGPEERSWTQIFSPSFTLHTPNVQHHRGEVVHHGEWAVEEGVLSQPHQALPPLCAPNHQSTNQQQLFLITSSPLSPIKSTLSALPHCLVSLVE
ncbi:hypothetical protein M9458_001696 [Cirrhinus mrigala]|uniref:Integrase catalytic domain-containing protein n=1 Tax=Cirrhinus mrigala TaxID=683832 RepID=A0ABD0RYP2_CIRMR